VDSAGVKRSEYMKEAVGTTTTYTTNLLDILEDTNQGSSEIRNTNGANGGTSALDDLLGVGMAPTTNPLGSSQPAKTSALDDLLEIDTASQQARGEQ
jgi:hypothetical protein